MSSVKYQVCRLIRMLVHICKTLDGMPAEVEHLLCALAECPYCMPLLCSLAVNPCCVQHNCQLSLPTRDNVLQQL